MFESIPFSSFRCLCLGVALSTCSFGCGSSDGGSTDASDASGDVGTSSMDGEAGAGGTSGEAGAGGMGGEPSATDCIIDDDSNCIDDCIGACPPKEKECVCPDFWDPVCGVDGRTYGNGCEARCADAKIAHAGECDDPSKCRDDEDCPKGLVCELGGQGCDTPVCVVGCHEDAQCEPGEIYQRVECVTCPCPGLCSP